MKIAFRPKLLDCLPGYTRAQFARISLPASPSVSSPAAGHGLCHRLRRLATAGIWTAIVGRPDHLGPGRLPCPDRRPDRRLHPHCLRHRRRPWFRNLLGATMLAGLMLLAMGIARMGPAHPFHPGHRRHRFHQHGIAVVIFMAQIRISSVCASTTCPPSSSPGSRRWPPTPIPSICRRWAAVTCHPFSCFLQPPRPENRVMRRAPGPLAVLVVGTLAAWAFELPVRDHRQPLPMASRRTADLRHPGVDRSTISAN